MIKVLYFARLREELNTGSETMDTVPDLRSLIIDLRARGGRWADVFGDDQLIMMSVNQEMADPETSLADGDEVAFFPPVTGG
ncbi:MAG: MoaD/ThiS family protein [Gammaproteobacteria bacterium]|nr:MoaD/ThiS family protein [Gammaproteobacteria bacterium]MCP5406031.1 MoaD/ThiS family protein [Chromatiaceae bacterium]MCP5408625.1 MoaD/ThiS family protein [Chromatiaceae bacterium]MCP5442589.1 MoaD/ThiS family protein [Chromatiaceae bacterium]